MKALGIRLQWIRVRGSSTSLSHITLGRSRNNEHESGKILGRSTSDYTGTTRYHPVLTHSSQRYNSDVHSPTMRTFVRAVALLLPVVLATASLACGFTAAPSIRSLRRRQQHPTLHSTLLAATAVTEFTVQGTIFSGEPNARALTLEHRSVLAQFSVWSPSGDAVRLDDLLCINGEPATPCIAVFLRSLG
jgi:hypothetical protein